MEWPYISVSDILFEFEIDHGANIYTTETGRWYQLGLFFPESWLLNIYHLAIPTPV